MLARPEQGASVEGYLPIDTVIFRHCSMETLGTAKLQCLRVARSTGR